MGLWIVNSAGITHSVGCAANVTRYYVSQALGKTLVRQGAELREGSRMKIKSGNELLDREAKIRNEEWAGYPALFFLPEIPVNSSPPLSLRIRSSCGVRGLGHDGVVCRLLGVVVMPKSKKRKH